MSWPVINAKDNIFTFLYMLLVEILMEGEYDEC